MDLWHHDGADALVAGHYLLAFRKARRVDIPIRIWRGPPIDPETGEEMDRSWRWQIEIAGALFDGEPVTLGGIRIAEVGDFWPAVAREPITADDYRFRVDTAAWAQAHDPNEALGTPGGRIDPMTATLPGM